MALKEATIALIRQPFNSGVRGGCVSRFTAAKGTSLHAPPPDAGGFGWGEASAPSPHPDLPPRQREGNVREAVGRV
jgi:hypothetical protein